MGCNNYINRARHRSEVARGYAMLDRTLRDYLAAPVLSFDLDAADWFDRLATQRLRVATMDLRIAAITLSRGQILLTRNVGDFGRVPGLLIEDWTKV